MSVAHQRQLGKRPFRGHRALVQLSRCNPDTPERSGLPEFSFRPSLSLGLDGGLFTLTRRYRRTATRDIIKKDVG